MDRKPLTLAEAKTLRPGMVLNIWDETKQEFIRNSDGSRSRYKVTSVKTWKRQPDKVEVRVQHGLYQFYHLKENMFCEPGRVYLQPMTVYGSDTNTDMIETLDTSVS